MKLLLALREQQILFFSLNSESGVTNIFISKWGFPGGSDGKNLPIVQETWVQSLGQKHPLEKEMDMQSREFHGQRILVGYSPWGHKKKQLSENFCMYSSTKKKKKI